MLPKRVRHDSVVAVTGDLFLWTWAVPGLRQLVCEGPGRVVAHWHSVTVFEAWRDSCHWEQHITGTQLQAIRDVYHKRCLRRGLSLCLSLPPL